MSRFTVILFALALLPLFPYRAYGEGVHIISLSQQGENSWLVREFMDNSILDAWSQDISTNRIYPRISLADSITDREINLLTAEEQPLLVFTAQNCEPTEEKLLENIQDQLGGEASDERARQLAGGIFRIPAWPYLAVSEFSVGNLETERTYRIQDYRKVYFPASSFAGRGNVGVWHAVQLDQAGAFVEAVQGDGEGSGMVLEYLLEGNPEDLSFELDKFASAWVLYSDNNVGWAVTGKNVKQSDSVSVINRIESAVDENDKSTYYSEEQYFEDGSGAVRILIAPGTGQDVDSVIIQGTGAEIFPSEKQQSDAGGVLWRVLGVWVLFGIFVAVGNLMYGISEGTFIPVVLKGMLLYPLIVVSSMLTMGYWGLGFLPAAVLSARLLALDGKCLAAMGVFIGSVFLITLVSLIIIP